VRTTPAVIPVTRPPAASYVDIPITRHRVAFSYLGSPTAMITVFTAFLILAASTLPLATVDAQWCFFGCTDWGTVEVTLASLVYSFPLLAVVLVGAPFALIIPAVSLLARTFGRAVRSLGYVLFGVFSIIAVVSYGLFYAQYTPMPVVNPYATPPTAHASAIMLHYPFYLILVAESVLIAVGVLEWLRRPALLFRAYTPPPPKPPKPKRMPVPEVAAPTVSQPLPPEVVEPEVSIQPPAPVGRPLGVTLLAACNILSAMGVILSLSFTLWIQESFSELATILSLALPDVGYFWAGSVLWLVACVLVVYGLLKGRAWAYIVVRLLCALSMVAAVLGTIVIVAIVSPLLSLAAAYSPLTSGMIVMVFGSTAVVFIMGFFVPVAIYWYMGRPHVKAYFRVEKSANERLSE